MQPEQPNSPSEDTQSTDAPSSEPSSEQPEEKASGPSWWQRMFNRGGQEPEAEPEDKAPETQASKKLELSQEELDRRVQAEADRREYKRQADARAQQRKQLRDTDPWAYAEEERKAEEAAQSDQSVAKWFQGLSSEHDRVAIDPLIETLPPRERERILKMDGAGQGLKGRKLVVTEAMKSLEKHWKAEGEKAAERKLRSNAAFRKQVLAESRGQTVEPELLPAMSASEADQSVSMLLRSRYGLGNHNEAG
jgi:hypothetical protein